MTNDLALPATDINNIHRLSWQIELVFKWIKQNFIVKHFFGINQNPVYGQIWFALIRYSLLQNICQQLPKKHSLLEMLRAIQTFLYQTFSELVATLSREPAGTNRGRRSFKD
ncbi:transposase [Thermosinus carboxydivorans]|uniref:transposase n=1 Tax=Thermosinus carboxydivorans TaxID=261685 RepID=UPI0005940888|nr:transposase [Thermosinus carboxydivorans]